MTTKQELKLGLRCKYGEDCSVCKGCMQDICKAVDDSRQEALKCDNCSCCNAQNHLCNACLMVIKQQGRAEALKEVEKIVNVWFKNMPYRVADTFRQVDSFDIENLKQFLCKELLQEEKHDK